jgi:cbb3-type cytochrome oxidase subunit 3
VNQVFRAAAEHVTLGWLMGVLTLTFLLVFLGWTWWAYSARNRAMLDQVSRMPLSEGGDE